MARLTANPKRPTRSSPLPAICHGDDAPLVGARGPTNESPRRACIGDRSGAIDTIMSARWFMKFPMAACVTVRMASTSIRRSVATAAEITAASRYTPDAVATLTTWPANTSSTVVV
jgi:hypothetical protein